MPFDNSIRPPRTGPLGLSRRDVLCRAANGFGGLALAAMLAEDAAGAGRSLDPMLVRAPHFEPKAKSVIFLFMDGGPSHVDTFDPKPRLREENGKPLPLKLPRTANASNTTLLGSFWDFRKYGQSGMEVSDLFPNLATCADDLCMIRSMVSDFSEHTAGNYFMHSGSSLQGRPSMGAWVTYGLGSPNENLPGFIVLDSGMIPPGGLDVFGSGFLPASYQGTLFRKGEHPVADLAPRESRPELQRNKLGLLSKLDSRVRERYGPVDELEAAIHNYELAFKMQTEVPDLIDFSSETETTKNMYGLDEPDTEEFGRQCLIARRLVERGVRFIELLSPKRQGIDRWDQHGRIKHGLGTNCKATDKPMAGLIKDLKSRGLLDQTLLVWGGEFGRTPTSQGSGDDRIGRDHHPWGFTMWMAGGGSKGGHIHGATDEYGFYAVEDKVHVHDLHATILHLLGMDHKRLTFHFSGRDMRLTDVHGVVVGGLLA
ncbi:MAG TPA: DUF1501 domain-containing protein [Bryobacterales bacterium]|nr:DUF1501 domain-containing protein [Bryobacterales bacterium]